MIAVFGDYDVDGVCSTAMLLRDAARASAPTPCGSCRAASTRATGCPARRSSGCAAAGVELLVTVDCGITAVEQVAAARAAGLDVVITDHHRPGEELPDCTVVHPALGDYGCPELCASGVVLKLSRGAVRRGRPRPGRGRGGPRPGRARHGLRPRAAARREPPHRARGLVALGRTRKAGLRALMEIGGVAPGELVRALARLPARPAHQRGRPDAASRRRARAAPHGRPRARRRGGARARPPEPRPPGGGDAHPVRRRGGLRPAGAPGRDRGGGGGLASRRRGDRGLAARGALAAAVRGDRARRPGRGPRLGPQHLRLRPPRRARRVLGAPRALRRPPDGGRGGASTRTPSSRSAARWPRTRARRCRRTT